MCAFVRQWHDSCVMFFAPNWCPPDRHYATVLKPLVHASDMRLVVQAHTCWALSITFFVWFRSASVCDVSCCTMFILTFVRLYDVFYARLVHLRFQTPRTFWRLPCSPQNSDLLAQVRSCWTNSFDVFRLSRRALRHNKPPPPHKHQRPPMMTPWWTMNEWDRIEIFSCLKRYIRLLIEFIMSFCPFRATPKLRKLML